MHSVGELFCKLEMLTWEQDGGDGGLFLSSLFKLLPLVLEVGDGEEEANYDVDAFFCGFLVSLSSSVFNRLVCSLI
jgi:predicted alpha-1,6-mannanase (GH76 family)